MSNIKLKNQIERYENPETVFINGKFNDYKYVVKSNQSDVIIFAKDKKFFKNRKPYVKKLLISNERFDKAEKLIEEENLINKKTDRILCETISNIAKENTKLKETCDGLTSTIMNQNNTTNKLNNLISCSSVISTVRTPTQYVLYMLAFLSLCNLKIST